MKTPIEKSIFLYTLYLACAYQVYQLINGLIVSSDVILFNTWILAFLVVVLLVGRKIRNIQYLAFSVHLIFLPIMLYFWVSFGGFSGTVPLVLYVYAGWIILTLRGALQGVTIVLYALVFIALTQFPDVTGVPVGDPNMVLEIQLAIDFLVVAIIIAVFLIYIKNTLLNYRKRIGHRHQQLDSLATTLLKQKDRLQATRDEIQSINENLEGIIERRVQKIEEKKAQLEEYAFINAHILRGPLCRIMGLATLMNENEGAMNLSAVHKRAKQVDSIIRRINEITR